MSEVAVTDPRADAAGVGTPLVGDAMFSDTAFGDAAFGDAAFDDPTPGDAAADVPVIEFAGGLVGFPTARHFVLVRANDVTDPVWYVLRCLEDPNLRFLVTEPGQGFPDYAPEIDDATAERLGLDADTAPDAALLLIVVTLGATDEDATANLFAPLVLNRTTRQGAQAVLSGSGWSLREPLYA